MTIKQATVINYQSHKKTVLNFHPGVNVLVGLTDCGKSAFMRALIWPIRNKNEDRGFRSKWGGKCDVEIVFEKDVTISRVQDKNNAYYLNDPANKVDNEYKAFKTDIPEDIVEALNMSEINIQGQFDRPFLLDDSPGDVAKILNKIANLTDIDDSISNIRKLVLANSKDINTTESIIADLQEQEKEFAYLEQMEKDVTALDLLYADQTILSGALLQLEGLIIITEKYQKELAEINTFLKAEPELTLALALVEQQNAATGQIKQLESIINTTERYEKSKKDCNYILSAEVELNKALQLTEKLNTVQKEGQALQTLINTINKQYENKVAISESIILKNNIYAKLMPDTCPLCEKELR